MKKLVIVYVVLIIALVLLVLARSGSNFLSFIPSFGGSSATAEINGHKIKLIVAKSEDDRSKGLSGRKDLAKDQGMLFVFPQAGQYAFWMKEMKFAIDIIYINGDKVVYVVKNAPPPGQATSVLTIYKPDEDANLVLELNAGQSEEFKIKKGTTVKLSGLK